MNRLPNWFAPAFLLIASSAFAQPPARREPRLWTVLVSVEGYQAPIPSRPGAYRDGRLLARWMTDTARWGSDQILQLNDNGDPRPGDPGDRTPPLRPTSKNLDWAMEKWLTHPSRVDKDDVVLFAFAGRAIETPGGEALLPIDGRPGGPGWSPERWVERLLRDYKCSTVLCWVDAPVSNWLRPDVAASGGEKLLNRLARWPGSSAWMATGDRLVSGGSAFAEALRAALGEVPRPLLATLSALDRDPEARGVRFRQLGGIPADLTLFRDQFQPPRKRRSKLLVQDGHAGRVTAIAFQADGRSMVTASDDSTIRVWDPTARQRPLLRVLPEFLNGVTALALGTDGRHLAGGDGMGEVLAWDLSGTDARPLVRNGPKPHGNLIKALAFLPEEPASHRNAPSPTRFVSIGQDDRIEVWDINAHILTPRSAPMPRVKNLLLAAATRPGGPSAFAVIGEDGLLRAFDRSIRPGRAPVSIDGGRPTALQLDPDGRRAVVGTETGAVKVIDMATGKVEFERGPQGGPVSAIRFGPGKLMAIGSGGSVSLIPLDHPNQAVLLDASADPIESVEILADGGWLAARTGLGDLFAWKLEEGKPPLAVKLDATGGGEQFACLAFGPASTSPILAAGENDGGIRRWDLKALKEYPRLIPHRGKVRQLSATPDGRRLLQLTEDGVAQVWDLKEGRNVRTLAGIWSAGAFLPSGRLALARHPDEGGGLEIVEASEGKVISGVRLIRPEGLGGDYARVVASRDGRRLAASASPGRPEEVHVWDIPEGQLRTLSPHDRPLTALDLSPDGDTLLTGSEDGAVRLWDLAAKEMKAPVAEYRMPQVNAITAAKLAPDATRRVVAAGLTPGDESLVLYWSDDRAKAATLGRLPGRVLSVTFLGGGRYVAAAGQDRRVRIWELVETGQPEELTVQLTPGRIGPETSHHHSETINDLLAWPLADGPSLASGSDDSTIRVWRVEPSPTPGKATLQLLGTMASAPAEAPGARSDAPWVAYTPEGVYDASLDGERLVTFGDGRKVDPLDQYAPRLFHPLLTDQFRRGLPTPPKAYQPPPPLVIEAPEDLPPAQAEAEIKVALGDLNLKAEDLRLYQNDVPVRDGSGFEKTDVPGEFVARVHLVRGENRLYAMAGRLDDVDARSTDLILFHAGPDNPGKTHVIALGVGRYARNALQYPVRDADQVADYLRRKAVGAGRAMGLKIVLDDDKVETRKVREAFATIRKQVKDHPEDTVVVFLAGHTDVLATPDGQSRYSLLLPKFPFPETDPAQALLRGPDLAGTIKAPVDAYLAYSTIYRDLTSLDALQRLVIVDACQAEAVFDDPGVRLVEQLKAMDREARQTRTSYFLASRRGEPAEEAPALQHGLLTYVLLRGMGDRDLLVPPEQVAVFRDHPSADIDKNGTITTRELRRFVDLTLPRLSDTLPSRIRSIRPSTLTPASRTPRPFDSPRLSASGPSFPIVKP